MNIGLNRFFCAEKIFVRVNRKAFSILEIFVVLSILFILVSISVYYYNDYLEDARKTVRITNLKLINEAISRYYKDNNSYPKYVDLKIDSNEKGVLGTYLNLSLSEMLKEIVDVEKEYIIKYRVVLPPIKNLTGEEEDILNSSKNKWISDEDYNSSSDANKALYTVSEIIATHSPSL